MKKLSAIILAAVLLFTLAACSDKEETDTAEATTEAAVETTAAPEEEVETTTEPEKEPEKEPEAEDEIIFSGSTVADNKYCKILISEIKETPYGTSLTVEAENKSSDMNLAFIAENCCINGVLVNTFYAENLSAGEKSTDTITFSEDVLRENGITKFTGIEITFRVFDADNLFDNDVALETVRIYPYGESKAENYNREEKATDIIIFDTDEVSAVITNTGKDSFSNNYVNLYLENKSADTNYTFEVAGCAINGVEINCIDIFNVPAGKVAFEKLYITDSLLTENVITDLTDIYVAMRVFDTDSWDADYITDTGVHIYPDGQENADGFTREIKDTDTVIADTNDITIIITGIERSDLFEAQDLCFYVINKSDKELLFSIEDVTVNGYRMDPFFAESVKPGFSKFSRASWYDDDLAINDIEKIEKIEFTMPVRLTENYESTEILNETVIYTPVISD